LKTHPDTNPSIVFCYTFAGVLIAGEICQLSYQVNVKIEINTL